MAWLSVKMEETERAQSQTTNAFTSRLGFENSFYIQETRASVFSSSPPFVPSSCVKHLRCERCCSRHDPVHISHWEHQVTLPSCSRALQLTIIGKEVEQLVNVEGMAWGSRDTTSALSGSCFLDEGLRSFRSKVPREVCWVSPMLGCLLPRNLIHPVNRYAITNVQDSPG